MIELINAQKTFNKGTANEIVALNKVSLTINENDFLILLGSNGSGKSTLLNAIAGSFLLDAGEINIDRVGVTNLEEYKRAKYVSRIFQNPMQGTIPELSILENFRLAALRTKTKVLKIGADKVFEDLVKSKIETLNMGLENKVNQNIELLSGGQRQALTLLMSVMDSTKVLLLDEPTAALDPRSSEMVMQTAQTIITNNKLTTILVTHRLKDAIDFGNRLMFMKEGNVDKDITSVSKSEITLQRLSSWF